MKSVENTINIFRGAGYRVTPQRRAIFNILASNESHPNTEDIYYKVKMEMPEISRTTVYNTLKEMTDLGVIDIVSGVSENVVRYDPNTDNHNHLQCLNCHSIVDIGVDFKGLELPEKEARDFQIIKQQVTFFGYCPDCQKIIKGKR